MAEPKFLLTQFNEGAAGKFLMSLLMGSDSVAHFDQNVEKNKTILSLTDYVQKSFQSFDHWLVNEPNPTSVWNIYWISNKMERGATQSPKDFKKQLATEASEYFWQCVQNNKRILIVSNKTILPAAYQHVKPLVIINERKSLKFIRKSLWYKHYGIQDNKIYLKINDPEMIPEPTRSIMKRFNNPIHLNESVLSFYRRVLWKNPNTRFFSDQDNFNKNSIFINLSEILDINKLVPAIDRICKNLGISQVDHTYIQQAHAHWINLHTFKF